LRKALWIPDILGFYACVKIKLYLMLTTFFLLELHFVLQLNTIIYYFCGYFSVVNADVAQVWYV